MQHFLLFQILVFDILGTFGIVREGRALFIIDRQTFFQVFILSLLADWKDGAPHTPPPFKYAHARTAARAHLNQIHLNQMQMKIKMRTRQGNQMQVQMQMLHLLQMHLSTVLLQIRLRFSMSIYNRRR